MSQNTDPRILNISGLKDWSSRGFYEGKNSKYLEEDFRIREYLEKELKGARVESVEIERDKYSMKIFIKTGRPALVIGRGGERVTELKKGIDRIIENLRNKDEKKKGGKGVKVEVVPVKNSWESAQLASEWIAEQLERRTRYRRVIKMGLSKIMQNKDVEGARVQVSGRLNGITISRSEWLQEGNLPRQNIRSVIDYGFKEAKCTYGVIGVKVWIYKGEEFK